MHEAVRWLYDLQHFGVKLGLDTIRAFLEILGRPDRAYPIVLVGGTNGKGSVAAMLEAVLRAAELRTGLFTSPHLVRPNERIRIAGKDISDDDLCRILFAMREASEAAVADRTLPAGPSFFEVVTASALTAFGEAGVDIAVLEVGMGGRLDATNAVDAAVSVIVTVDYDHTGRLGETLDQIAWEKAGIVKPGRRLVTGVTQNEAIGVIRDVCRERGAPIDEASEATIEEAADGAFSVVTSRGRYDGLRVSLAGRHQHENARVAIVALERIAEALGVAIPPAAVRAGLASVRWPGRLQWVDGSPPVLLDGAHNPAGARTLAAYLDEIGRPAVLVFAAMREKKIREMLDPLERRVERVVVTRASVERALEPDEIAVLLSHLEGRVEVVDDPGDALDRARATAPPGGIVVVSGSLYLVGDILGRLEGNDVPGPVPM